MLKTNQGIIQKIRKSRTFKGTCMLVLLSIVFEIAQPTVSLALTEGPSQPEVQSFEPIGTTQMVDLFTGDFNYNIPLFNLPGPNGGYPVNLAYHAGSTMDDEASWVGLGWNINVGSLVRSMRGLPDEFQSESDQNNSRDAHANYDYLKVQSDMKQSWTLGIKGGLYPELFGANLNAGDAAPSLSASIYYNNYNGIGVSLDPSVSFGNGNTSLTLGLSLDSENGLGVSAEVGLYKGYQKSRLDHSLSVSFDGSLSVDYNLSAHQTSSQDAITRKATSYTSSGLSSGAGFSFARNGFTPSVNGNIDNYNLSFSIKTGFDGLGFFAAGSLGLFYNTQDYSDADKNGRRRKVVGYARSGGYVGPSNESTNSSGYTRDFIRNNDGQITKSTMFLPNSQYAYDVYNSTGQGLIGYFRTRRADVGRSFDPYINNNTQGLNVSLDFSNTHMGGGFGLNYGFNSQGPWNELNALQYDFLNPSELGIEENTYYQAHGEQTILALNELDYMRGLNLPFVRLKPKSDDNLSGGKRRVDATASSTPNGEYAQKRTHSGRVVRNTVIHDLKNEEVGQLGEFNVKHFSTPSQVYGTPQETLNRDARNGVYISGHPAGYKVLNQEGSYYVYGLPCYNNTEVDNLFSVSGDSDPANKETVGTESTFDYKKSGSNKFINKTTKSPYAHSYLLTGVQGADYVDLTNDGPTNDDMGYWVKFNYLKSASNFKWRAPYEDNQYSSGQLWTATDDKASYQYGEKEMWYLGQIETKTHIAIFEMEERSDMKEAAKEYEGSDVSLARAMKLTKIKLYDKKTFLANPTTAIPLQTVVFGHHTGTDELCKGAPNASNGKLTLRSVHFLSNGSTRGAQNQYKFDYANDPSSPTAYDNPNYRLNSYDAWGMLKPRGTKYEHHSRFPYVNQFNQDWNSDAWEPSYGTNDVNTTTKELTQLTQDQLASAWCLKKITLPSGGSINIQYESDDYGYVQHKTANQMFKIHKLGDDPDISNNQLYDNGESNNDFYNTSSFDDEKRRRIFFKLEEPIPTTTSLSVANKQVYDDYVAPIIRDENGDRNLYFKTKMRLVEGVYDYVSGYLPLEPGYDVGNENYNVGVHTANPSGGFYRYGYVTVKAAKHKNGDEFHEYHPMALAGWTYLQTNASMILNNSTTLGNDGLGSDPGFNDILNQLNALGSIVPAAAANFGAIRPYCKSKGMAKYIDLDYSCIRLASPDKKKFGGGHRVKEISITDNWSTDAGASETDRTYGQRFEYSIIENGKTISSGVAQYEPQAGGDENALKYPIYYFDKQNLVSKNNLFAEAPMNESLFPGSSVGYRKVTVKSINTAVQLKNAETAAGVGRTGGVSVHEFFTAKEFPTMVSYSILSEENSTKDVFNMPIIIPLIGSIKRNYYHGTQAYMIELNDMHGKPKSVETFELNGYAINANPITSASYEYQYDVVSYQDETVKKLNNYVTVIADNNSHKPDEANKRLMGVETDLYTDQRESKTFSMSAGLDLNVDIPFIPWLSVWPTFSNHKTMFRTYVTNKVVHRTGILKRTKTRDLQSVNESEIIAYDEKSGIPLLTKVKNEFGDDFYNYNIPAYYVYDRMGHAYKNINYSFETTLTSGAVNNASVTPYLEFDATGHFDYLVRGDELLITTAPTPSDQYKKVYFLGWKYTANGTKALLHSPFGNITVGSGFKFRVIRSGNRNQFGSSVASYTTKGKFENLILTDPSNPLSAVNEVSVDPADNLIKTPQISSNSQYGGVLSAGATVLRDDWSTSIQLDLSNDLVTENPFLTGNSGIWRPFKSYSYIGARKTNASMNDNSTSNPELFNDGVFENPVKMFTWDLGNMEDYVSNWEWVNEITRYSPDAYELENKNRIGIFSSALYGYDNSLSIGVSGNSEYNEVGVFDFETIIGGDGVNGDFMKLMSQTNLNFDNSHAATTGGQYALVTEQFTIKKATVDGNYLRIVGAENTTIPGDYFRDNQKGDIVGLSLTTRKTSGILGNLGFYFNGIIQPSGQGSTDLIILPFLKRNAIEKLVQDNAIYHGVITYFIKRNHVANNSTAVVSYPTTKAHTGKKCMKLTDLVTFDQPKLKLKTNKKYVFSCWVSKENENVASYEPNAVANDELVQIGKMTNGTFAALATPQTIKYGKIVEGWQKIDIEFNWDNTSEIPAIRYMPGTGALFVDDIRVSPKTGGLATYVYDSVKYWLTASLNVDNYATFFYYDEEGNLHLKKQETEKGIVTLTESRGHVSN